MKQIAAAAKQGTGGVARERLKSLTAGSKAPRNVPADPPNTLVEERNCTFEPPPAPAPARSRPRAEVGAASRRKFGLLGKTLAAAKADTSRDKLGGDLGKLPPASQRALRARIARGALRPSEVTRDAALFGELCALPPAKCDEAVEAFLGMLDRDQGNRSEMLRRAVRGDQRSRLRFRDDAPAPETK